MNVVVTGARGFLGARVVVALRARGCLVTPLGREDGDLATESGAARALAPRSDVVINLAGPVTGGGEPFDEGLVVARTHAQIALNVRRFAKRRIVHASSTAVYGLPQADVVNEQHARVPQHLYGLGKLLAEDVLDNAVVLRFGGLFCAERTSGALFRFCRAAREGTTLNVTTPVPTPWEICHVDDAADAISLAAISQDIPSGPINIGYGEPVELGAIARRIAALGGNRSRVEVAATHPVFQLDIARAKALLGWAPPSLDARLAALYAGYTS